MGLQPATGKGVLRSTGLHLSTMHRYTKIYTNFRQLGAPFIMFSRAAFEPTRDNWCDLLSLKVWTPIVEIQKHRRTPPFPIWSHLKFSENFHVHILSVVLLGYEHDVRLRFPFPWHATWKFGARNLSSFASYQPAAAKWQWTYKIRKSEYKRHTLVS